MKGKCKGEDVLISRIPMITAFHFKHPQFPVRLADYDKIVTSLRSFLFHTWITICRNMHIYTPQNKTKILFIRKLYIDQLHFLNVIRTVFKNGLAHNPIHCWIILLRDIYCQHNCLSGSTIKQIVKWFKYSCSVEDQRVEKYSGSDRRQEHIDLVREIVVEESTMSTSPRTQQVGLHIFNGRI